MDSFWSTQRVSKRIDLPYSECAIYWAIVPSHCFACESLFGFSDRFCILQLWPSRAQLQSQSCPGSGNRPCPCMSSWRSSISGIPLTPTPVDWTRRWHSSFSWASALWNPVSMVSPFWELFYLVPLIYLCLCRPAYSLHSLIGAFSHSRNPLSRLGRPCTHCCIQNG